MSRLEYKIHVSDAVLEDLNARLRQTRWPEPIPGSGWTYGADIDYIRELCTYWSERFDWRAQEHILNAWPQYVSTVDGVDLHYWHIKGKGENPFPLLLIHGWPGSAYEFFDLIEPLTNPAGIGGAPSDSFDLIIPDLPGFGFGGAPNEPGWGAARVARAFHTLMTQELGYRRYGAQGGDWGSMISSRLGALFPEQVAGIHINFVLIPTIPFGEISKEDQAAVEKLIAFDQKEGAYHLVQETKPDSLTIAQSDSPAGLAAWITEKFRTWGDCGGEVERRFSKDKLLTDIMFYWATNSAASAARLYYESHADPQEHFGYPDPQITVPTAIAYFPFDPFNNTRSWAKKHFNLVRWTDMPRGGHFAAMEEPELLADDITAFFRTLR